MDELQATLIANKADAAIDVLPVLHDIVEGQRRRQLLVADLATVAPVEIAVATPKDAPQLLSIINKALGNITVVEHERIRQRWFASFTQREVDWSTVLRWALPVGLLLFGVLAATSVWNRRLQQQYKLPYKFPEYLSKQ